MVRPMNPFRLFRPRKKKPEPIQIKHSPEEAIEIAVMYDTAIRGEERNRQEHRVRFFERFFFQ